MRAEVDLGEASLPERTDKAIVAKLLSNVVCHSVTPLLSEKCYCALIPGCALTYNLLNEPQLYRVPAKHLAEAFAVVERRLMLSSLPSSHGFYIKGWIFPILGA